MVAISLDNFAEVQLRQRHLTRLSQAVIAILAGNVLCGRFVQLPILVWQMPSERRL
jgi:hypothetical protein